MKMNLNKLKRMMLLTLPAMKIVGFQRFVCRLPYIRSLHMIFPKIKSFANHRYCF